MTPILTVIIPVYNLEDWITECLDSILKIQSHDLCFEIVAWNDGSKDRSEDIVTSYVEKYPHIIRLESHDNHGVSYSRNRALEKAHGEYVWFVDGDDMIDAEIVPKLIKKIIANNLDLLQLGYKDISPQGNISESYLHLTDSDVISGRDLYLTKDVCMAPWAFIYRKSLLMDNGIYFPENFKTCEDIQFNQKALFFAKRAMTTSSFGYYYRQRPSSATQGYGQALKVMTDHVRRLPLTVDYYLPFGDKEFLTNIVYRNAREILVWLWNAEPSSEDYHFIKKTLRDVLNRFTPNRMIVRIYLYLLSRMPKELCAIQRGYNRIKLHIIQ